MASASPNGGRSALPALRRETTERQILAGARELLSGGLSWQRIGVRQLAERAGISRTAFYAFFPSKNAVLRQLVDGEHDELLELLRAGLDGTGTPGLDQAGPMIEAVATFNLRNGAIHRALLEAAEEDAEMKQLEREVVGDYCDVVARAIDRLREQLPQLPTTPPSDALARVLLAMTERTLLGIPRGTVPAERRELLSALLAVWERAITGAPAVRPSGS